MLWLPYYDLSDNSWLCVILHKTCNVVVTLKPESIVKSAIHYAQLVHQCLLIYHA